MVRFTSLSALVLLLASAALATEHPPDALTIIQRMKAALEPTRPSIRTIALSIRSPNGFTTEWTARQARKRLADGGRILTVIVAPEDIKGVALLIAERKNQPDQQWLYLPTVHRVREIIPVAAYEAFLGTDFTFADLGFVNLRDRTTSLLGEDTLDGRRAYKVQEVPAEPHWYYSRIVSWVAKDSLLPLRRDFYDGANQLWKSEVFQDVTVVDGVPTVLRIRMEDKLQQTSTELRVSEVRYDVEIPDGAFDPQKLGQASEHPIWTHRGL